MGINMCCSNEDYVTRIDVNTIKIAIYGDTAVGKSSMIKKFVDDAFIENYEPTVLDVF